MFVALTICEEKLYLFFLIFAKWRILDREREREIDQRLKRILMFFLNVRCPIVLRGKIVFVFAKWRILD